MTHFSSGGFHFCEQFAVFGIGGFGFQCLLNGLQRGNPVFFHEVGQGDPIMSLGVIGVDFQGVLEGFNRFAVILPALIKHAQVEMGEHSLRVYRQ